MEILRDTNIDFMKYRKFWVVISLIFVLIGFLSIFVHGRLNLGVDFAGGTQMTVKFNQRPDVQRLREVLSAAGIPDPQIQTYGPEEENQILIKTRLLGGSAEGSRERVETGLRRANQGEFSVLSVETVGPQIGKELRRQGFWAVALSLLGMLAYIWFRFELRFGIGAIMACLHDVLVTLGLFALAGYEFNLTTVAAFLTLVGYSVNDTVVIFDRIRENMRKSRREPLLNVMNASINQTLSRTILTGGSTLLVLACLLYWGGEGIRGFAFVMFVGIIVGTYSSIYIAPPFTLLWEQYFGNRGSKIRGQAAPLPAGGGKVAAPQARPEPTTRRAGGARR
jgi:preprotein translocase subunit SecF